MQISSCARFYPLFLIPSGCRRITVCTAESPFAPCICAMHIIRFALQKMLKCDKTCDSITVYIAILEERSILGGEK